MFLISNVIFFGCFRQSKEKKQIHIIVASVLQPNMHARQFNVSENFHFVLSHSLDYINNRMHKMYLMWDCIFRFFIFYSFYIIIFVGFCIYTDSIYILLVCIICVSCYMHGAWNLHKGIFKRKLKKKPIFRCNVGLLNIKLWTHNYGFRINLTYFQIRYRVFFFFLKIFD